MTYALYNAATLLAAALGAPWLAVRSKHRPLLARFNPPVPELGHRPLCIQACSVGELGAANTIANAAQERWPQQPVLLTVSTVAARDLAARQNSGVNVTWFPFDFRPSVRRFLRQARPRAVVLVETEIWPNLIREAHRENIPVLLMNGRLSDKHFPRYARIRPFLRTVFARITTAAVQNDEYAQRFIHLGVRPDAVHVTGSTKFDAVGPPINAETQSRIRQEIGFPPGDPIIVFGSTRPGDEALAANCWRRLRDTVPRLRLIVAPRHLDRLDEATAPFNDEPILHCSRLRAGGVTQGQRILLLDTVGELNSFYSLATIAVIGGSFFPGVNGHNPLEPAALGIPTVFGPFMRNFIDPARVLLEAHGALQAGSPEDLPALLEQLLANPERRRALGERARQAVRNNQGAVQRNLDLLAPFLETPGALDTPENPG